MLALMGTFLSLSARWAFVKLREQRGQMSAGALIAGALLLMAYYMYPEIFNGFITYVFNSFLNAIDSVGQQKSPSKGVPVTTNKSR